MSCIVLVFMLLYSVQVVHYLVTSAWVLVRRVVLTLTSRCVEIGLLMVGSKQYWDTRFILVLVVARTSSRGALVALYCEAPRCS
jgi:hypothetical protein